MALWLVRMGRFGEYRQKFLDTSSIYVTWDGLNLDLKSLATQQELVEALKDYYPDAKIGRLRNNAGQIWPFAHAMEKGDWVVIPDKPNPTINIAEITGDYRYDPKADDPYYHFRSIKWIAQEIPRQKFDQDLLYSFGAFMTICRIQRNDAENRVRAMASNKWQSAAPTLDEGQEPAVSEADNLEENARTQIANIIARRFKGKKLEGLINAVLQAKGYTTHWDDRQKADGGVDILAASGPMGFGHPKICVQVKSEGSPIGTEILDRLVGTMDRVKADQGLLVSWGGFKDTVLRQVPEKFFHVRMWNQDDIIDEVLANYTQLGVDIQAELPLKQIWTVALDDEG